MSAKKFLAMNELALLIQEKIKKLEEGKLLAEELSGLSNEIRDLYDRIVVLQYKAMEKGLKTAPEVTPKVVEVKPSAEVQPMKFSMSSPVIPEVKKEVVQEIKPVDVIPPAVEIIQPKPEPVAVVAETKIAQTSFFEPHTERKESSINEKMATEHKTSIAEKYASEQKTTIAEKFASEQKMSLADKLKMTRINDLRSAIGINQKFLFMNDLFEGENTVFNNAINRLNSCGSGGEAKSILVEYSVKYGWKDDTERVVQFFELIERRYL